MSEKSVSFNEFREKAGEANIAKKAITRYFFPKHFDSSVKRYELAGMPIVRKIVMGTTGRIFPRTTKSNYRLGGASLEKALDFATGASVINEAVHTGFALGFTVLHRNELFSAVTNMATDPSLGHAETLATCSAGIAINGILACLQRYNRARITKVANFALEHGHFPKANYENWLRLDGRTAELFNQEPASPNSEVYDWAVEVPELQDRPVLLLYEGEGSL